MSCTSDCRVPCNIAHDRIALESRIIRRFIREAKKDGWTVDSVFDGEETIPTTTERAVLESVFSVDESAIRFRHTTRNRRSFVAVVLGNGIDCLVDCGESMSATYDRVADYCETLS